MLLQLMRSAPAAGAGQNVPSATDALSGAQSGAQTSGAAAGASQPPPAPAPGGDAASQFAVQTLASLLNYQQTTPTASNTASMLIGQLDTNGDSQLSLSEIEKALGATTSDQIAGLTKAFAQVDANGDGQISQSELAAAIGKAQQDGAAPPMAGLGPHHHHHGFASWLAQDIVDQLGAPGTQVITLGDLQSALGVTPSSSQGGATDPSSSASTASTGTGATAPTSGATGSTGSTTDTSSSSSSPSTGAPGGVSPTASASGSAGSAPGASTLAQGFARLDANGDGQLSVSELTNAIQSFRQALEASWTSAWATERARFSTAA